MRRADAVTAGGNGGMLTEADFEKVQTRLLELLGENLIAATYMCPDGPAGESGRRKPSPAMVHEAGNLKR